MSKRDANRDAKRALIVETARHLMQAETAADFSMRVLSEAAGVSTATPYALFGSKQALVAAVMDADFDDFVARLLANAPREETRGFAIFFRIIDVAAELFRQNPAYYRAGALAIQATQDRALTRHFGLPRHALLRDLVSSRIQQGEISHQVNADLLARTLGHQFHGWMQTWAKGDIELDDLVTHARFSMGLGLAAVATGPGREALLQQVMQMQSQLPPTTLLSTRLPDTDPRQTTQQEARS